MYEFPVKKEEEKKPKIIPFNVHFTGKLIPGKSYIRTGLPKGTPHTVTEKFWRKAQYNLDPEKIDKLCEKLTTVGPREKYGYSVTENQRYGWYHDVKFTDMDKTDPRLHFGQRMDHFIKLHLLTMDKK